MKKIYLVSVWVCTKRTCPVELENHYFACRATGKRAAQNAAARKFKEDGYDVDLCVAETDERGNLITADTADELKAPILERIANYEANIAATEQLSDADVEKLSRIQCARRLLDYHALEVAKKKLAALDAVA